MSERRGREEVPASVGEEGERVSIFVFLLYRPFNFLSLKKSFVFFFLPYAVSLGILSAFLTSSTPQPEQI